ncbi:MAG: S24/S26 family peptidase [Pseudomonadota bacterium]
MFGFCITRIYGHSMQPLLRDKSFALFRAVKRVKRGDVVLVDHPEFGMIVKSVSTVSRTGQVGLRGLSKSSTTSYRLGLVDHSRVKGRLVMRLFGGSLLPSFRQDTERLVLEAERASEES